MSNELSVQQRPIRMVTIVLVSAGLALLFCSIFALFGCMGGYLFGGINGVFVILAATVITTFVIPIVAMVCRRRQKHFQWPTLVGMVSLSAFLTVAVISHFDTRKELRIFASPSAIPEGVEVLRGKTELFGAHVHFAAPPATIVLLLQAKGLIEVPADPPESGDTNPFSSRIQSGQSWDWWQPATMPSPKFYYRHHQSEAAQGWGKAGG